MMHMRKILIVSVSGMMLASVASQSVASDRSMRCGPHLIYAGGGKSSAGMYEVLKKCGEPEAKNGNSWIYTQGSMVRFLTFNHEGRLQRIESRRK